MFSVHVRTHPLMFSLRLSSPSILGILGFRTAAEPEVNTGAALTSGPDDVSLIYIFVLRNVAMFMPSHVSSQCLPTLSLCFHSQSCLMDSFVYRQSVSPVNSCKNTQTPMFRAQKLRAPIRQDRRLVSLSDLEDFPQTRTSLSQTRKPQNA